MYHMLLRTIFRHAHPEVERTGSMGIRLQHMLIKASSFHEAHTELLDYTN
jgi:hypothetical protein